VNATLNFRLSKEAMSSLLKELLSRAEGARTGEGVTLTFQLSQSSSLCDPKLTLFDCYEEYFDHIVGSNDIE